MSIWSKMTTPRPTGLRRYDEFEPVKLDVMTQRTGKIEPTAFSYAEEFEMAAIVSVKFWANRAQLERAKEVAMKSIGSAMYAEELGYLSILRSAIMDGDRGAALSVVELIATRMKEHL